MNCAFHAQAPREFIDAIDFYERRQTGLVRHLAQAVREVVEQILQNPGRGHPAGPGVRRCAVRRFPYHVIYVASDGPLLILAVAHGRRQPGSWRARPGGG